MILARLLSATPQTDGEHWDLAFRWHFDAWNTDIYAQNPAPYQRNPQLANPGRPPYPWRPGVAVYTGFDALFPDKESFGIAINTSNSPPTLDISGRTPINALPVGFAPQCPLFAAVSTTGGTIPTGIYLIVIAAGPGGPVSTYMIQATIPAACTTGSITVPGVVWQYAAPGIQVYGGPNSQSMRLLTPGSSWTGGTNDTYGNPTVFTITGIDVDGLGLPDIVFNSFLFQAKDLLHGGVWGDAAASVSSSGGFATATNPGWTWSVNQWAGYIISRYDPGPTGPMDFLITSNTATTLTFASIHGPPALVPLVMRAKSGSITSNTIGDANFINAIAPSGLTANQDEGNLIRIIAGTGAGQPLVKILSNTATVFTIGGTWAVTPDSTSIFIVEAPTWRYSVPTSALNVSTTAGTNYLVGSIPLLNFSVGQLLVEGLTVDINGNWSIERYAPIREVYVPGQQVASGRVFLIYTSATGTDVSPNVVQASAGTSPGIVGVLRDTIAADLTVQVEVNATPFGIPATIPAATAVGVPVYTYFPKPLAIAAGDIVSWDILASDGSTDANSIASFTLIVTG